MPRCLALTSYFNPRTPCGVRHVRRRIAFIGHNISIHAPRVGCDKSRRRADGGAGYFNPRTPCGVRRPGLHGADRNDRISIHAPRVGCDGHGVRRASWRRKFQSTHPVWGATWSWSGIMTLPKFQSTHPVWGATPTQGDHPAGRGISIHAPRVGCDFFFLVKNQPERISIHAPRVGCDAERWRATYTTFAFQSTHPVWGATLCLGGFRMQWTISIHAPRVGCDDKTGVSSDNVHISIHAPRVGCDFFSVPPPPSPRHFNPRTPCGVRLGGTTSVTV